MVEFTVLGAPRGALSYTRLSREELGGMFLGLMTYLGPKGLRGTAACQETGGRRGGVEGGPSGDPRDMEKCLDWLKPSLQLMQSAVRRNDA